ncbi:hypothetical protein GMJLKIPL_1890 [Methylobacterium isbiliense]|uniref:Uncharacterized protein n=1 Tax=Methylobacterium isbiliense TaxID=315478 RepID=A0ABQ4SDT9_9HYPH|nr:hypothetical protein GMJLKIPL_1890 [Methylobacterium isbiliense]
MHERDAIAALRLVHEVRGQEDGDALVAREVDQRPPEGVAGDRIDARGRLVEDEHGGPVQHGHRQLQPLLDPEGQSVGPRVLDRTEVVAVEQLPNPHGPVVRRQMVELGVQFEVLQHRQLAVEREGLRHVADVAARLHVVLADRAAEQPRVPLRGGQEAGEHLHRGGLAAAVRAEEAEDLAAADAEADVVHRREGAEAPRQVLRLDRRLRVEPRRPETQHHGPVLRLFLGRQERDEGGLHVGLGRAGEQLGRGAARDDLAVVQGHQPLEARGLIHVGGRHHHAHAGPSRPDRSDQVPELPARERIDARRRLVEDQEVGIMDQRAAEAKLLLHAAGQFPGRAVLEGVEAGRGEKIGDAPPPLARPLAEEPAVEVDVLEHAERRVEVAAEPLGHVGDARTLPRAVAPLRHVAAEHPHAAPLDPPHARHEGEQGRLADAVRPDHPHHPPRRQAQRHVVERDRRAIAMRDAVEPGDRGRLDHGNVGHGSFTARSAGHWTSPLVRTKPMPRTPVFTRAR